MITAVLVLGQAALGVAFRHGIIDVIPHVLGALVVAIFVVALAMSVLYRSGNEPLRPAGVTLLIITAVQVFLGLALFSMGLRGYRSRGSNHCDDVACCDGSFDPGCNCSGGRPDLAQRSCECKSARRVASLFILRLGRWAVSTGSVAVGAITILSIHDPPSNGQFASSIRFREGSPPGSRNIGNPIRVWRAALNVIIRLHWPYIRT